MASASAGPDGVARPVIARPVQTIAQAMAAAMRMVLACVMLDGPKKIVARRSALVALTWMASQLFALLTAYAMRIPCVCVTRAGKETIVALHCARTTAQAAVDATVGCACAPTDTPVLTAPSMPASMIAQEMATAMMANATAHWDGEVWIVQPRSAPTTATATGCVLTERAACATRLGVVWTA